MTDPDHSLAVRARRGDRSALCRLYDRHRSRLFGFLVRATGGTDAAEDVFQEVWMKVLRHVGEFDPERGSFRGWLFRIASNTALDRARRERVRAAEELDAVPNGSDERRIDRLAAEGPGTDRRGEAAILREVLARALRELPPVQRSAVLLRHQQGMSYSEVAASLGVAEGTAKSMVFRGVRELRLRLGDWNDA